MSIAKFIPLIVIAVLIGFGLLISLRAGLDRGPVTERISNFGRNLGRTVLTVGSYLAGLAVLQQLAGFRMSYGW